MKAGQTLEHFGFQVSLAGVMLLALSGPFYLAQLLMTDHHKLIFAFFFKVASLLEFIQILSPKISEADFPPL